MKERKDAEESEEKDRGRKGEKNERKECTREILETRGMKKGGERDKRNKSEEAK